MTATTAPAPTAWRSLSKVNERTFAPDDPGLVSDTDLQLTPDSPAIGRGEPLGCDHDIVGNPVPPDRPDAGAYQFRWALPTAAGRVSSAGHAPTAV